MIIGPRLEERLAAKHISQSELARRVGINQSSINGLIRGSQRSSTKLHQIARELQTTPAYLTGESDDPASELPSLDAEGRELLDRFESLTAADRKLLLGVARSMAGGAPPSDTVHGRGGVAKAAQRQSQSQSQSQSVHAPKQGYNGPPPDDEGESGE